MVPVGGRSRTFLFPKTHNLALEKPPIFHPELWLYDQVTPDK